MNTLLPCPFCGGTDLDKGYWVIDEEKHELVTADALGELDAIECNRCLGSAPKSIWNTRSEVE